MATNICEKTNKNSNPKKIYFDVGAHNGSSMFQYVQDPNNVVYAFEPTPKLVKHLEAIGKGYSNYIVIPKAVSNYNGTSKFYIMDNWDYSSSLNRANSNIKTTWPLNIDFNVTQTVDVDVIKLKDFIDEHVEDIPQIDYFHCDTQGCDLEVLMGMEDHLTKIISGVIEMPSNHNVKFYADQRYIAQDAVKFLTDNHFKITNIEYNDHFGNEQNIFFSKIN